MEKKPKPRKRVTEPSFDDTTRRIYFRREFLKRADVDDPLKLDVYSESDLSPIQVAWELSQEAYDEIQKMNKKGKTVLPRSGWTNLSDSLYPDDDTSVYGREANYGFLEFVYDNGIDRKDKTITVKISLNAQEGDILLDIQYLLDILKQEDKLRPKKERLGLIALKPRDYKNYLKVWDLKKAGKKPRQIVEEIFGIKKPPEYIPAKQLKNYTSEEEEKEKKRYRQAIRAQKNWRSKLHQVRRYHEEAKQIIAEIKRSNKIRP